MKTNSRRFGISGFTLIELLVVISIISLLISILLPALQSARESGKSIQCASQQRQAAIASLAYAQDYKFWFAPVRDFQTPTDVGFDLGSATWGQILLWKGYITQNGGLPFTQRTPTRGIFKCPNVEVNGSLHGTYGFNSAISGYMVGNDAPSNDWYGTWKRTDDLTSPGETYLHGDSAIQDGGGQDGAGYFQVRGKGLVGAPMMRHMNNAAWNVIYADGHGQTQDDFVADNAQPAVVIEWKGRH